MLRKVINFERGVEANLRGGVPDGSWRGSSSCVARRDDRSGPVSNIWDTEEPSTCRRATADRCVVDRGQQDGVKECECGQQVWEHMQVASTGPIEPLDVMGRGKSARVKIFALTTPPLQGGEITHAR